MRILAWLSRKREEINLMQAKGKKINLLHSDVATVPITVRASVSTKSITILTSLLD